MFNAQFSMFNDWGDVVPALGKTNGEVKKTALFRFTSL
jgi:hypothetical protein